ncbi:MAG: hypothetical protein KDB03_17110 [Planctomycetales bacterium]|nr:hypothetical protein [Planctomycetales bacterium]
MQNPKVLVAATCVVLALSSIAWSQNPFDENNPFAVEPMPGGIGGQGFGTAESTTSTQAVASADVAATKETNPLVKRLHESPPSSVEDFANAVTWMVRIHRWDEVGRLFEDIQKANFSLEKKAEMARVPGALWLRTLADESELTPDQQTLAREIIAAPGQLARSAEHIRQQIAKLSSAVPSERRLAQFRLQDGGVTAIETLVQHLLTGDTQAAPIMLSATIAEMGPVGVEALEAACVLSETRQVERALLSVAQLPGASFHSTLGGNLFNVALSDDFRRTLADALQQRHSHVPNEESVRQHLAKAFASQLSEYQRLRGQRSQLLDTVWHLDRNRSQIERVSALPENRVLERLHRLGYLKSRQPSAGRTDWVEHAVVSLQRDFQFTPQESLSRLELAQQSTVPEELSTDAGFWQEVVNQADLWQMHGAASLGLARIESAVMAGQFLAPLDFLSDRLVDARPIIRYSALTAIHRIDPSYDFAGTENAIRTALEMLSLGDGPRALFIGADETRQNVAATQFSQLYNGTPQFAYSARSAMGIVNKSEALELIFITDRVSDMAVFELMQRLRGSRGGKALPIAVLADELYEHERSLIRSETGIVLGVLTSDSAQLKTVVDAMYQQLDTPPLSSLDRARFAMDAGSFLTRIAGDRKQYHFYPVELWQQQLVSSLSSFRINDKCVVLSGVGTAECQRQLIEIAGDTQLVELDRMAAAKAFHKNVQEAGTLISLSDIKLTYDRYNELGPTDPATVKALGLVLDVLEAQSGKRTWPVVK